MRVGDVALAAGAYGNQQRFTPAAPHVRDEFLLGPKFVPVAVDSAEYSVESFLAPPFVFRKRNAETGMARWKLGPDGKSEVAGHFISFNFPVIVLVEMNDGLPKRQWVDPDVRTTTKFRGGGIQDVFSGDRGGNGFAGEAGNEPFLRADFHVVTAHAAVAQDDKFGSEIMFPNHRG